MHGNMPFEQNANKNKKNESEDTVCNNYKSGPIRDEKTKRLSPALHHKNAKGCKPNAR